MPMIDVYAPVGLFPSESLVTLGFELTHAILRAEGVKTPGPFHLQNTASFIHLMEPSTVTTAANDSLQRVRVQIITPPKALNRDGQIGLVREVTEIVARHAGDPSLSERTWVLLSEAAEGGWGIGGIAYGKGEFLKLAAKARAT